MMISKFCHKNFPLALDKYCTFQCWNQLNQDIYQQPQNYRTFMKIFKHTMSKDFHFKSIQTFKKSTVKDVSYCMITNLNNKFWNIKETWRHKLSFLQIYKFQQYQVFLTNRRKGGKFLFLPNDSFQLVPTLILRAGRPTMSNFMSTK